MQGIKVMPGGVRQSFGADAAKDSFHDARNSSHHKNVLAALLLCTGKYVAGYLGLFINW